MPRFLACALLMVAGCGEPQVEQGITLLTITFPPETEPYPDVACAGDPRPEVMFQANPCEFFGAGMCEAYLSLPSGPCTLPVTVSDATTGERICVQEADFVVSEVGDTEVHFTVDDCEPVSAP